MSTNYRAPWHDYTKRSVYHITLLKNPGIPDFGSLVGDYRLPIEAKGSVHLEASYIGKAVKRALKEMSVIHPALRVYQYALMPDHLHLLLGVEADLDEVVGRKIGRFKHRVNEMADCGSVFAAGFHDCILDPSRTFATVIKYLRANAYRLAIRKAHPDFFRRVMDIELAGNRCSAYGNIQLLSNPFKAQVIVHRADSDAEFSRKKDLWLYTAANGGVLVSPFVSKREKEVRQAAEALGGSVILIGNTPLAEREKPSGHNFELCASGRLLYISLNESIDFSRLACNRMNHLAEIIASGK